MAMLRKILLEVRAHRGYTDTFLGGDPTRSAEHDRSDLGVDQSSVVSIAAWSKKNAQACPEIISDQRSPRDTGSFACFGIETNAS